MKVTQHEIVEALRPNASMYRLQDKRNELADRIKAHGIAPPDGWVLVPKEPTAEMLKAFHWKNVGEGYVDMLAAAPDWRCRNEL